MKMISKLAYILALIFIVSCGDSKYEAKDPEEPETINSGKLTVYCDDAIKYPLDSAFKSYAKDYQKVELDVEYMNSRDVMAKLLSGDARVVVNARDYLEDEDSLMKEYGVEEHQRFKLAYDALVFFVNKDFPVDTLNAGQLESAITSSEMLKEKTSGLEFEPEYAIPNQNTSVFANFNNMILKDRVLKKRLHLLKDIDSVKNKVKQNSNVIGIGYMSQLIDNKEFKMLRFGFIDEFDLYLTPKPVHQGYIVQDKYPYKVTHYAYLRDDVTNLPYWFATYLAKEEKIQRYFLDYGLVPAFAKIKLTFEE